MNKLSIIAASLGFAFVSACTFAETEPRDLPGKAQASVTSVRAKVTSIAKSSRKVTVQLPEGETKVITAGPEVRNFDQIEVGDEVVAEVRQVISIFVTPPGTGALVDMASSETRAKLGEKPAAAVGAVAEVRSTVEGINYEAREITLKGPAGRVETFVVSDEVKKFNNIKKGDELVIRAAETVAIAVNKVS